jgi:hypothetical protein
MEIFWFKWGPPPEGSDIAVTALLRPDDPCVAPVFVLQFTKPDGTGVQVRLPEGGAQRLAEQIDRLALKPFARNDLDA